MDAAALREAATFLTEARRAGRRIGFLPEAVRPRNEDDAYAVQFAVHDLVTPERGARRGWKIGCTTPVMQDFVGLDSPCAGGMFESGIHSIEAAFRLADYGRLGIESEIAVRLGADLAAGGTTHDIDSVTDAVAAVMVSMEVVEDRYEDYRELDAPALIADDFFHVACVLGPEVRDWRSIDLPGLAGRTLIAGQERGSGHGADIMGHPFAALAWLANRLDRYGVPLRAGDVVTLGSVVATQWVDEPAEAVSEIDGLGIARAQFS